MDGCIDKWMDGRMEGWMDGGMTDVQRDGWRDDGCIEGWMDVWMDGCMDGWVDGRMDGWMDGLNLNKLGAQIFRSPAVHTTKNFENYLHFSLVPQGHP